MAGKGLQMKLPSAARVCLELRTSRGQRWVLFNSVVSMLAGWLSFLNEYEKIMKKMNNLIPLHKGKKKYRRKEKKECETPQRGDHALWLDRLRSSCSVHVIYALKVPLVLSTGDSRLSASKQDRFSAPYQWCLLFFFFRKGPELCSGAQSPHLCAVLTYSFSGNWHWALARAATRRKRVNPCLCWNETHLMRQTGEKKIICRYWNKMQEVSSWKQQNRRVMCVNI